MTKRLSERQLPTKEELQAVLQESIESLAGIGPYVYVSESRGKFGGRTVRKIPREEYEMGKNKSQGSPRCKHRLLAHKCEHCELEILRKMAYAYGDSHRLFGEYAVDASMECDRAFNDWKVRFG